MKNKKGLTLIEIIMAISLTVLVIGSVYLSLSQGLNDWRRGTKRIQLLQQAQNTVNRIVEELRYAEAINSTGAGLSFDTQYVEDDLPDTEKIIYTYTSASGELERKIGTEGTNYLIATDVTKFSTKRVNDVVTVDLTLKDPDESAISVTVSSSAYLRNI